MLTSAASDVADRGRARRRHARRIPAAIDHAVQRLSPAELTELGRLLQSGVETLVELSVDEEVTDERCDPCSCLLCRASIIAWSLGGRRVARRAGAAAAGRAPAPAPAAAAAGTDAADLRGADSALVRGLHRAAGAGGAAACPRRSTGGSSRGSRRCRTSRRRHQQARNQILGELRRLTNPQTRQQRRRRRSTERLKALRDEDDRAAVDLKKAYEGVDETLDVRQQARFRIFEERMEQQKLELLMRARQNARRRSRAREELAVRSSRFAVSVCSSQFTVNGKLLTVNFHRSWLLCLAAIACVLRAVALSAQQAKLVEAGRRRASRPSSRQIEKNAARAARRAPPRARRRSPTPRSIPT